MSAPPGASGAQLINATAHVVRICDARGATVRSLPPSGLLLRAESVLTVLDPVTLATGEHITLTSTRHGALTAGPDAAVPAERPGVLYVVSALTAQAAPERGDLLIPGPSVRDGRGRTVGCLGLQRLWRPAPDPGPA